MGTLVLIIVIFVLFSILMGKISSDEIDKTVPQDPDE